MRYVDARVHLERAWASGGGWNVYILSYRPGGATQYHWNGDEWVGVDRDEGAYAADAVAASRHPYSLHLPDDLLERLVAAATEKLPADGSMANHLKDAQGVRDRLLTLIEARGLR